MKTDKIEIEIEGRLHEATMIQSSPRSELSAAACSRWFVVANDPECYETTETTDMVEAWKHMMFYNPEDACAEETARFREFAEDEDNWQTDQDGRPSVLEWDVGGESGGTITFYRINHS